MKKSFGEIKVFISRQIPEPGPSMLRKAGFDVTMWPEERPMRPDELLAAAAGANALLTLGGDKINAEFLQKSAHLDIVSQFAVGYDNISLEEATRLGIPVANTPDVLSDATADIAFGLMIAVSRKMFFMHKQIEQGKWDFFRPKANLGIELKNKTLGIFGLGRIGMEMALRCRGAYGMGVIYCNRNPNPEAEKMLGASRVNFEELLSQSDVLSVHCVLSSETRGIFNREAFGKMKPTSIFINTARGGIHQEEDLIAALLSGKIWGAGLDVTNPEPMKPDNPLLTMPNAAVLPHIGSATVEARSAMSRLAAQNILDFYQAGRPTHLVNPGVFKN
jgi:glyoxylate reductase